MVRKRPAVTDPETKALSVGKDTIIFPDKLPTATNLLFFSIEMDLMARYRLSLFDEELALKVEN